MLTIAYKEPNGKVSVYKDEGSMFSVLLNMENMWMWEKVDKWRQLHKEGLTTKGATYDCLPDDYRL